MSCQSSGGTSVIIRQKAPNGRAEKDVVRYCVFRNIVGYARGKSFCAVSVTASSVVRHPTVPHLRSEGVPGVCQNQKRVHHRTVPWTGPGAGHQSHHDLVRRAGHHRSRTKIEYMSYLIAVFLYCTFSFHSSDGSNR